MINICSVGGSFEVDMAEGPEGYVCTECGSQFKGIEKIQSVQNALRTRLSKLDNIMYVSLNKDEIVFISHNNFFLGIVKTLGKSFLLETDREEIVLGTGNDDILAVSSLFKNSQIKGIMLAYLYSLRELSFPL